ncbi:MAG TPA: DUF1559 domain-containing protein [Sedimentisphaerales bacterium]|nr:DUF1559 domain-containing protein [Sedimentisphaerales bacterium]
MKDEACDKGAAEEENAIGIESNMFAGKHRRGKGVTVVELLAVVGCISLLAAILLPAAAKIRRNAQRLQCMTNLRQIALAVNNYALDNDGRFPDSVATIGSGLNWHWQEPTMMTACKPHSKKVHRSMSAYLRRYIKDTRILFCPSAPDKYRYLQASWDAGDDWDNPETSLINLDPATGTYCFYWNYTGILETGKSLFLGPRFLWGGRGQSKLLAGDYLGYDHWRSPGTYGSCEEFKRAQITEGSSVSSAYWSSPKSDGASISPYIRATKVHACYTDGHVESYGLSEATPMKVSITSDGSAAYPDGVGAGVFYLPQGAAH